MTQTFAKNTDAQVNTDITFQYADSIRLSDYSLPILSGLIFTVNGQTANISGTLPDLPIGSVTYDIMVVVGENAVSKDAARIVFVFTE